MSRSSAFAALAALLLTAGIAAAAVAPPAAGDTALDRFLQGLSTLRADFRQALADSRGRRLDESSGKLVVVRPGRFRWEIAARGAAAGQLLVADGRNLWFFDRDLEQVNVKPMDAGLSATPAMLLSGVADVRTAFDIAADGSRDGLDWVRVTPKRADADFRDAELGFARGELRRMVLHDKLGQTATVSFERVQRNAPVAPDEVRFTPPAGADVIGTPKP